MEQRLPKRKIFVIKEVTFLLTMKRIIFRELKRSLEDSKLWLDMSWTENKNPFDLCWACQNIALKTPSAKVKKIIQELYLTFKAFIDMFSLLKTKILSTLIILFLMDFTRHTKIMMNKLVFQDNLEILNNLLRKRFWWMGNPTRNNDNFPNSNKINFLGYLQQKNLFERMSSFIK